MAVTAPVTLTKIRTEFGGIGPFSDYVRGGGYVDDTSTNSAISTTVSGLDMGSFVGAEKADYSAAQFVWANISGTNSADTAADSSSGYNTDINLYYTATYNSGSGASVSYSINGGSWTLLSPSTNFSFPVGATLKWRVATSFSSVNVDINVYNNSDGNAFMGGFNADITDSGF